MTDRKAHENKLFLAPIPIVFCRDKDVMWYIDATLGGLFKMDLYSWRIEEIVSAQVLFEKGFFRPVEILCKAETVWIIPDNLIMGILVYDEKQKTLRHNDIWKRDVQINGAHLLNNMIYLFPLYDCGRIYCGNPETGELCDIYIYGIAEEKPSLLWEHCIFKKSIFVPRGQSKGLIHFNTADYTGELLFQEEMLVGICESNGEIWVLPREGHCIKSYDADLKLLKEIDIRTDNRLFDAESFCRITVTDNMIILMPWHEDIPMLILRENQNCWSEIKANKLNMAFDFDRLWNMNSPYYLFFSTEDTIEIMPLKNNWVSVSSRTESYEYRMIDYKDNLPVEEVKRQYISAGNYIGRNLIKEESEDDLSKFVNLIS